jgi:uncharacterized protein
MDQYVTELGRMLRRDVHPVILNFAGEGLLREVFEKGRCVVTNDEREIRRFKALMLSRIAEFGDYRTRMQEGLTRNVMKGAFRGRS